MIENVVGVLPVPLGIAVNFLVNDKDYLIPMAIEQPSVVAAASHAAKMARAKGGLRTSSTEPIMIGQVQRVKRPSPRDEEKAILSSKQEILNTANQQDPTLVSKGGGAKDLRVRILPSLTGTMVISELLVDCRDAMGANVVNTMAEAVAPMLEKLSRGNANLRIISNLADRRIARATAHFSKDDRRGGSCGQNRAGVCLCGRGSVQVCYPQQGSDEWGHSGLPRNRKRYSGYRGGCTSLRG